LEKLWRKPSSQSPAGSCKNPGQRPCDRSIDPASGRATETVDQPKRRLPGNSLADQPLPSRPHSERPPGKPPDLQLCGNITLHCGLRREAERARHYRYVRFGT